MALHYCVCVHVGIGLCVFLQVCVCVCVCMCVCVCVCISVCLMYEHAICKEYMVLTSSATAVVIRIAYSLSMFTLDE